MSSGMISKRLIGFTSRTIQIMIITHEMADYAVNLGDIVCQCSVDILMLNILLGQVAGAVVQVGRERYDDVAVVLDCEEHRAIAIIDVIRRKFDKNALRCYRRHLATWRRI